MMISRDKERGGLAHLQVASVATWRPLVLRLADLSAQAEVRRIADEFKDRHDRVDILINNAGSAFQARELSTDALELTWATNQLAPLLARKVWAISDGQTGITTHSLVNQDVGDKSVDL